MLFNEFKAWLLGFKESIKDGQPTKEQWLCVLDQLDRVRTSPLGVGTYTLFNELTVPTKSTQIYPPPSSFEARDKRSYAPSFLRSWKDETKKDFDEFLNDCSGQDEEIPCGQIIKNVHSLIDSLPIDLAFSPVFGLEDNGTVLLEWYKPSISENIFSVIIEKDKIIYSLRDEEENLHGCLSWGNTALSMVNTILKKY